MSYKLNILKELLIVIFLGFPGIKSKKLSDVYTHYSSL